MELNIVENILTKNDCYRKGDTIKPIGMQLHTIGTAQNTSKALRDYWNQSGVEACVHYCIDAESEGLIRHFLPDNRRSWGDGGFGNANLITVELMESDYMKYTGGANYTVTNESKFKADVTRAYNTAVYFFAYKCKQYGWNPLEKMPNGLYRISSHDEGRRLGLSTAHVDPTHIWNRYGWTMDQFRRDVKKVMDGGEISINTDTSSTSSTKYYRVRKTWSDEKSQLGAYTILQNAKDNCPVGYSAFDESGKAVYTPRPSNNSSSTSGTHTSEFANLTDEQSAAKLLKIATPIAKEYGLLPSVLAAQCVLESGFCKTELAKKADNILGMKTNLLNSTWTSPTWDGKSSVTILTPEYYNSVKVMVNAPFRKYSCIEDCMKDRCAFFLNAKVNVNAAYPKYYGVTNCKTYKEQITFIKEHGYATDPNYISKVCDIIERYSLDANDGFSSTITSTKITKISEWIQTVKDWEQKMIDVKAVYSNKNNKTDYEVALKQKPVLTNCALFVTHALQVAGIFGRKDKFYGSKGTLIKGSAASKMGSIGKITTYTKTNVTADKANIPVGAIVTWHEGHTNVYLGKNDKGQMQWSDAGRGTNVGCKENSYWKSFRKTGNMSGYHVANVIQLNLIDDVSVKKEDANEEIPTIEGKMYIVQAGAFSKEANAKKQVAALKKKGFEAIVKKRSNDWFVQCGIFKNKKNADDLITKLQKAGFSAILRF